MLLLHWALQPHLEWSDILLPPDDAELWDSCLCRPDILATFALAGYQQQQAATCQALVTLVLYNKDSVCKHDHDATCLQPSFGAGQQRSV